MANYKVALIAVWYGGAPPYFEAWSRSAEYLKQRYDIFLITDTDFSKRYISENIKLVNISMKNLINRITKTLDIKINVQRPYRFCDFKPMLGLVFQNELSNYDFWGHIDLDVIWGDMEQTVNDDLLSKIDVFLNGGHFSLYRNNEKIKIR